MNRDKSRREFHKSAALLAAASLGVAGTNAGAAQPAPTAGTDARAATAQALMDIIRARFGKHLNEDQLKRLRGKVLANLVAADRLQRVRLDNSAEPAFIFQADVP